MERRQYLGLVAAAVVAGCSGNGNGDGDETGGPTDDPPTSSSPSMSPSASPSSPKSASPPTSTSTATPTSEYPPVSLDAENVTAANPDVELDISYKPYVSSGDANMPELQRGYKWLFVRADVRNLGDQHRDLTSDQYVITADGRSYTPINLKKNWALSSRSVGAGAIVAGWMAFEVPKPITEATLSVREETETSYRITFTRDASLSAVPPI